MKAAVYERTGKAQDVLRITEVDRPDPGPGEVRVRVRVSGVNPTDFKRRSGGTTGGPMDGFQVPHHDGAGVIDAVGEGVDAARVGQEVWLWMAATSRWGTAAQWTVVPQEQAVVLPPGTSMDLGACLGVPAMTAHRCLHADGLVTGAAVLVAGGAGAVGHFAIELARFGGARVATTVSNANKAVLAAAAGADLVVNYHDDDAGAQLRRFAPTMDRIVEVDLGANLDLDLHLAGPATTVVTYADSGDDPALPVRKCMVANVTLRFVLLYGVPRPALVRAGEDITAALAAGALSTLPLHRFGLGDVAAAQDAVEAGAVGKVLVDID